MGNCGSQEDRSGKERSDAIDRQLEEDSKKFKKEAKILLLGSGESGKSTIVKQMKIIHLDGYTHDELVAYRPTIHKNVLDSVQTVILAMRKIGVDPVRFSNRALTEKVLDAASATDTPAFLSPEIADAIHQLMQDPIITKILDEHASEFYLMDSANYFFTDVLRIGAPEYVPTETDVLRARAKTTGISETRFNMGQLAIHMFDVGGQRSERKKWIHCFESVTSIIFCAALSEYDQVLLEAQTQNRMQESLVLFDSVINSRWFLRTSIILFLNKIDVFKAKLPKVPLNKYFPEYIGGQPGKTERVPTPDASNGHVEYTTGLRCGQGNDPTERLEGLWDLIICLACCVNFFIFSPICCLSLASTLICITTTPHCIFSQRNLNPP
ncbi:Heterotrimeric G-protein alpha subunit [Mycena indigotica]|uniref:Guanine nucleotide-binding protein subunit alpha n=1 Tax=Mycena indigotica TaxID=2126181 RepID=A0A8H6TG52_9AGAR|nr:Heterotrimeric G-protein alpha subunit [Mycena indigotica]KAF7316132.1 Heterotrimeric G-protein alpha subunit [Mycena indigotica]